MKHNWFVGVHNWEHKMMHAVMTHEHELKELKNNWDKEVAHLMVMEGCNKQCVDKMAEDGMLDDPGYVSYECECRPGKWVEYKEEV